MFDSPEYSRWTVAFVFVTPIAFFVPALVGLALVAAVWVGLHRYELVWWREQRAQRRATPKPRPA